MDRLAWLGLGALSPWVGSALATLLFGAEFIGFDEAAGPVIFVAIHPVAAGILCGIIFRNPIGRRCYQITNLISLLIEIWFFTWLWCQVDLGLGGAIAFCLPMIFSPVAFVVFFVLYFCLGGFRGPVELPQQSQG
jgi:hypothetical protein